ncbi:hypothetical protein EBR66_01560 [bacterium]|nr:hypothetical protein [bacterium]
MQYLLGALVALVGSALLFSGVVQVTFDTARIRNLAPANAAPVATERVTMDSCTHAGKTGVYVFKPRAGGGEDRFCRVPNPK